jgi:hypothetical protein
MFNGRVANEIDESATPSRSDPGLLRIHAGMPWMR